MSALELELMSSSASLLASTCCSIVSFLSSVFLSTHSSSVTWGVDVTCGVQGFNRVGGRVVLDSSVDGEEDEPPRV